MSFRCFKCHLNTLPKNKEYLHTLSVAEDAKKDQRWADAAKLLNQAHDQLLHVTADYHLGMYKHGHHDAWPGETVWLPNMGVSVGVCETCGDDRPCVNA